MGIPKTAYYRGIFGFLGQKYRIAILLNSNPMVADKYRLDTNAPHGRGGVHFPGLGALFWTRLINIM